MADCIAASKSGFSVTRHNSRPRAICIDLVETLVTEHHVPPEAARIMAQRDAADGFDLSRRGAEVW